MLLVVIGRCCYGMVILNITKRMDEVCHAVRCLEGAVVENCR